MDKEDIVFDKWNEQKKFIDKSSSGRFYREKEIWWGSLGKNIGSEQDGKGDYYERPVVIIKAFSKSVCLVLPLTTSSKMNQYYLDIGFVDGKQAYVIVSQIKLIDVKRLTNRIGIIDDVIFGNIRNTVRSLF